MYSYNLEGRLAKAVINQQQTNRYYYNQSGIRTRVESSGTVNQTNTFLNDPQNLTGFSQVLEELPSAGAPPTATYTIGSQIISQEKSGTVLHLLPDGHNSTRLLTDSSGIVQNALTYDGYGNLLASNAAPQTAYMYVGEHFDSDGRYYLRNRYFNPVTGQFGAMDQTDGTPQDPLSLHKYAYCQNNPVNNIDPSGNETMAGLTLAMTIAAMETLHNAYASYVGVKLTTEAGAANESLQQIEGQDASPDVDTATIIVHGLNGLYNGQPRGWSLGYQRDLQAGNGTPSQQEQGLRSPNGSGTLTGLGLNHDFYEFDWGGMSLDGFFLVPLKCVHEMAFVHLQMAQMLVWMKGYDKINIISHSWGTTLSYDLLNSGGIEMHDWVTMGSPLKKTTDKPVWVTGKWINCYSVFDPVTHFEIFPPYESGPAMVPNVRKGFEDAGQGIWGHELTGLTTDPNVDINHLPYDMGDTGVKEHGHYWNWAPCVNDLRKDLQ